MKNAPSSVDRMRPGSNDKQHRENAMKATRILAAAMVLTLQSATVFAQDLSNMQGMTKEQHR